MKCPYCVDITMKVAPELGKDWFKCPNCGATHTGVKTKVDSWADMTTELNPATGQMDYKPSRRATFEARKAREGKK